MLFEYRSDPDDTRLQRHAGLYRVDSRPTRRRERMSTSTSIVFADRSGRSCRSTSRCTPPTTSLGARCRPMQRCSSPNSRRCRRRFDRFADDQRRVPFDLDATARRARPRCRGRGQASVGARRSHHISIDAGTFDLLWGQIDRVVRIGPASGARRDVCRATRAWQRTSRDRITDAFWIDRAAGARPAGRLAFASPCPAGTRRLPVKPLDVSPAESWLRRATRPSLWRWPRPLRGAGEGDRLGHRRVRHHRIDQDHPDVDQVVGYHLNTLPMTCRGPTPTTDSATCCAPDRAVAEAIAHRTYP